MLYPFFISKHLFSFLIKLCLLHSHWCSCHRNLEIWDYIQVASFFLSLKRSTNLLINVATSWLPKTARIQILKKAGRPSERLVSHSNCRFRSPTEHECVDVHEITEAAGTEDAESDSEYDAALMEALRGVQDAVTSINDHLEEVRYEIEALESEYWSSVQLS